MSEYIIDSSEDELEHDDEVKNDDTQGFLLDYLFHSNSFNNIDSEKFYDSINYNNKPVEKWDYKKKLENSLKAKYMKKRQYILSREYLSTVKHGEEEYILRQEFINKPYLVTSSPGQFKTPHFISKETHTNTLEYSPSQQITRIQNRPYGLEQKFVSEEIKKFDYIDKLESDEDDEKLAKIMEQTDKTDYVHVPAYEIENVFEIEETSKFKNINAFEVTIFFVVTRVA